jgi:DNA-binding response OmpR family regulator
VASTAKHTVVLLVDDDVVVRNLVRRKLQAEGFCVLTATDADEALLLSRTCPERIDILVADVEMPGLDGVRLAEQITRERGDTAVLLMSGGTDKTIPEQMTFMPKPFSPSELVASLTDVLARRKQ